MNVKSQQKSNEPVKMTKIPEKPWQVVSVDYPDGHYNLVITDKKTRYPEVDLVHSAAEKETKV